MKNLYFLFLLMQILLYNYPEENNCTKNFSSTKQNLQEAIYINHVGINDKYIVPRVISFRKLSRSETEHILQEENLLLVSTHVISKTDLDKLIDEINMFIKTKVDAVDWYYGTCAVSIVQSNHKTTKVLSSEDALQLISIIELRTQNTYKNLHKDILQLQDELNRYKQ